MVRAGEDMEGASGVWKMFSTLIWVVAGGSTVKKHTHTHTHQDVNLGFICIININYTPICKNWKKNLKGGTLGGVLNPGPKLISQSYPSR